MTLQGTIHAIRMQENGVVTASADRTVKVYDWRRVSGSAILTYASPYTSALCPSDRPWRKQAMSGLIRGRSEGYEYVSDPCPWLYGRSG